jgi:ribosomal protein L31
LAKKDNFVLLQLQTNFQAQSGTIRPPNMLRHCVRSLSTSTKVHPRPATFRQIVQHTDGSIYTIKTTSPKPIQRLPKDIRNNPLWNPQLKQQTEDDESGQLGRFQKKFDGFEDLGGLQLDMEGLDLVEKISTKETPKKTK